MSFTPFKALFAMDGDCYSHVARALRSSGRRARAPRFARRDFAATPTASESPRHVRTIETDSSTARCVALRATHLAVDFARRMW